MKILIIVSLLTSLQAFSAELSSVPVKCRALLFVDTEKKDNKIIDSALKNVNNGVTEIVDGDIYFNLDSNFSVSKKQKVLLRGEKLLVTVTHSVDLTHRLVVNIYQVNSFQKMRELGESVPPERKTTDVPDIAEEGLDLYGFRRINWASGENQVNTGSEADIDVGGEHYIVNCSMVK